MATIAFILLCHKDPDAVIEQARQLTAAGDCISIHFDARAPRADFERITSALAGHPGVTFARRRLKCGWGEWSLVQATLAAVEAALEAFETVTHFYMVSGDCMAIKSARFAHAFLDRRDCDYIESFDFFESDWIRTGFKEERLRYRHWFNERSQKRLFYWSFNVQRKLGLTRKVPEDLQVMIGSQWWCLRRRTIEAILAFLADRRDVTRFFRTTWIPDETFFQTLAHHLVPREEIETRSLTFLLFSDYGMPIAFYNDHYDLLLNQDALFARKISPEARDLKARLGALYASDRTDFQISNEGRNLFAYLTGRGRVGRRFANRFWETESTLGRQRELMIVACKKWHVAKRLIDAIRQSTDIPANAYLFNEEDAEMPDLGGIERSLEKRMRHRRAVMRMLFDHHGQDRLIICLDTAMIDLMEDFFSDRSTTRLLEIECRFSDDYLIGHAKRVGLAGEQSSEASLHQLLPTIRQDVLFESDRIRDAAFDQHYRIDERASPLENASALAAFLKVDEDTGRRLAETPYLFVD